ncbi:CCDC189 isoform 2, partial [Pan troglodytes]
AEPAGRHHPGPLLPRAHFLPPAGLLTGADVSSLCPAPGSSQGLYCGLLSASTSSKSNSCWPWKTTWSTLTSATSSSINTSSHPRCGWICL